MRHYLCEIYAAPHVRTAKQIVCINVLKTTLSLSSTYYVTVEMSGRGLRSGDGTKSAELNWSKSRLRNDAVSVQQSIGWFIRYR